VPLIAELHVWLTNQFAKLSRNHDLAKAINYMQRRWDAFMQFLDDGRICITNNAAERALRCVPFGERLGCSAAPIAAANERPSSTRSSKPRGPSLPDHTTPRPSPDGYVDTTWQECATHFASVSTSG
jgi:hypothetical protein